MKRRIFAIFVLTVLAVSGHAADTNQTAVVSTNKAVSESSNVLAIIAKVGNAGGTQQTAIVSTNKPAWESSVSAGLSLTKGNSDTLLTTAAFNPNSEIRTVAHAARVPVGAARPNLRLTFFGRFWREKVRGTRFSASRRKPHASGVRSLCDCAALDFDFGIRV